MPFAECRKYPRIEKPVPCRVSVGPSDFQTQTKNLSCGGALCQLTQPLALMTKLDIAIDLPALKPRASRKWIRCRGVVIRQEPSTVVQGSPSYLTAIYFSELRPEDRRSIAEFVLQCMLSHGHRRP